MGLSADLSLPGDKASTWPKDFFENIRIDAPLITRPDQGAIPPTVDFTK